MLRCTYVVACFALSFLWNTVAVSVYTRARFKITVFSADDVNMVYERVYLDLFIAYFGPAQRYIRK